MCEALMVCSRISFIPNINRTMYSASERQKEQTPSMVLSEGLLGFDILEKCTLPFLG
jgi:hypothetical protein